MNNKFLLTSAILMGTFLSHAQQNKHTFAITGDGNNDFVWMNIRQVDLSNGQVTKTLFERSQSEFTLTDINSKRVINKQSTASENVFNSNEYPTGTFVAAAAYDKRSNKLFFTPMRRGELRWMDVNATSPTFYNMQIPGYKISDPNDEATNITRMVIGADGNGYALSNDANHFFTFTTGKKPSIKELGNIIDAAENKGVSIHNKCTSWGGDMIADAFGKLYVISANHAVFTIDPITRISSYLGNIQGLPSGYTTNAAAVNDEGEIVLASANLFAGYYTMKINDLKAVKMEGSDVKYNASDFANANLLLQKEANSLANSKVVPVATAPVDALVYPNPVTNYSFNVLFDNRPEGKYTIVVADLAGRNMMSRVVSVAGGKQAIPVKLNAASAKGVYIVKVLDANQTLVINEKVVVQ